MAGCQSNVSRRLLKSREVPPKRIARSETQEHGDSSEHSQQVVEVSQDGDEVRDDIERHEEVENEQGDDGPQPERHARIADQRPGEARFLPPGQAHDPAREVPRRLIQRSHKAPGGQAQDGGDDTGGDDEPEPARVHLAPSIRFPDGETVSPPGGEALASSDRHCDGRHPLTYSGRGVMRQPLGRELAHPRPGGRR